MHDRRKHGSRRLFGVFLPYPRSPVFPWKAARPYRAVYEKCKKNGEDATVLKTLENVIVLLTQTMQQLNATPAVRLIDELMTIDPSTDRDKVRKVMDEAFAGGEVTAADLGGSIKLMLEGMSEQDEAWEAHVAKAVETTSKEEFEQLLAHANGRMEAKRRLSELLSLCGGDN